jgi:hypothetical protein
VILQQLCGFRADEQVAAIFLELGTLMRGECVFDRQFVQA